MKFPRLIQLVWNDETQQLEVIPKDVFVHNKESVVYQQHVVVKENSERHRLSAFLKFILERDEYGNNLLTYCGTEVCPSLEYAVEMFNRQTAA